MSTYNIGFYEDLTKIIFELSSNIIKYAPYFFCCCIMQFSFQRLRSAFNCIFQRDRQIKIWTFTFCKQGILKISTLSDLSLLLACRKLWSSAIERVSSEGSEQTRHMPRARGYKKCFMLNSADTCSYMLNLKWQQQLAF